MAALINLVNQTPLDLEVGIKRVSVRELLRQHAFDAVTLYTSSKPDSFRGLIQPDGIIILVDGCQVQSLDETLGLRGDPCIEVIKVVHL